jgi:hypothetical protein
MRALGSDQYSARRAAAIAAANQQVTDRWPKKPVSIEKVTSEQKKDKTPSTIPRHK